MPLCNTASDSVRLCCITVSFVQLVKPEIATPEIIWSSNPCGAKWITVFLENDGFVSVRWQQLWEEIQFCGRDFIDCVVWQVQFGISSNRGNICEIQTGLYVRLIYMLCREVKMFIVLLRMLPCPFLTDGLGTQLDRGDEMSGPDVTAFCTLSSRSCYQAEVCCYHVVNIRVSIRCW